MIAGLILDDHDLIRQGIDTDPENPHLLFIGATLPELKEERLVMSTRLVAADPQNALSGFILAGTYLRPVIQKKPYKPKKIKPKQKGV